MRTFNDNNWQLEKIRANKRSREQKTLELSNKKMRSPT